MKKACLKHVGGAMRPELRKVADKATNAGGEVMEGKPAMKGRLVAVYLRVSTSRQADGRWSLDAQRRATSALAGAYFPEAPVQEFLDVGSGRGDQRPQFRRLMGLVAAGQVLAIVCVDLDRLCRNVRHFLTLLGDLERRGTALIASGQNLNTATPAGRLVATLLATVAEFESNMISARVKRGHAEARASRRKGPGSRPFGWKVNQAGELERDQAEQQAIDLALSQRTKGRSWREVAEILNDSGVRPVSAGRWTAEGTRGVMLCASERRAAGF